MFLPDFIKLLWRYSPRRTLLLAGLTLCASLTDGVGLVMILPVLAMIETTTPVLPDGLAFLAPWVGALSPTILVALFIALILLRSAIIYFKTTVSGQLQLGLVRDLRHRCTKALLAAEWQWLARQDKAHQISLIFQQIQRVATGVNVSVALLSTVVMGAMYLCVALLLSPVLTGLVMVIGGVVIFAMRGQYGASRQLGQGLNHSNKEVQGAVQETLGGLKQIRILGNEALNLHRVDQVLDKQNSHVLGFIRVTARSTAVFQSVIAILLGLLLLFGLKTPGLNFATLVMFVLIVIRMAPLVLRLQTQVNSGLNTWPAFHDVQDYLSEATQNAPPSMPQEPAPLLEHSLELRGVSLSYDGSNGAALTGLSCIIPANKTTLVQGPSGAGKSTLADIIMGLLTPDSGTVLIDGEVLRAGQIQAWRRSVSYVPQDIFMLNDSIRNNLLWAKPDADEALMHRALKQAAATFVFALPAGLDTVVGDGGQRFSGGERQRLMLARALLGDPQLLILDEATNALDGDNTAVILRSIATLRGEMTIVVISHQPLDLAQVDHVITLE